MPASTCQSESWERKGRGISLFIDCRAWSTRGLPMEADLMQWESATSMMLMNNEGGRRLTPSLSRSEVGRRSGWWERASGLARSLPGT
jgi:hypothetical protein